MFYQISYALPLYVALVVNYLCIYVVLVKARSEMEKYLSVYTVPKLQEESAWIVQLLLPDEFCVLISYPIRSRYYTSS